MNSISKDISFIYKNSLIYENLSILGMDGKEYHYLMNFRNEPTLSNFAQKLLWGEIKKNTNEFYFRNQICNHFYNQYKKAINYQIKSDRVFFF